MDKPELNPTEPNQHFPDFGPYKKQTLGAWQYETVVRDSIRDGLVRCPTAAKKKWKSHRIWPAIYFSKGPKAPFKV